MDMYDLQAHVIGTVIPTICRGCVPRPPVTPEMMDSTELSYTMFLPVLLKEAPMAFVWYIQIASITTPCALGPLLSTIRFT